MLWPKNSFGVVMWPFSWANAGDVVAAANASGRTAACQRRSPRIDIQNLRNGGRDCLRRRFSGIRRDWDGWNLDRLASGNTRQKGLVLTGLFLCGRQAARVRTSGAPSVIATVCSKCAERLPSAVTIVQRSASVLVAGPPTFT